VIGEAPDGVGSPGRRSGGSRAFREFAWDGLGLELAHWQPGPSSDGWVFLDDHMIFVTLSGTTHRTETTLEGEGRYRGADFPGAVSFIPARRRRRAHHSGGRIGYAAVRLTAGALAPGELQFRGFTNRADPLIRQLVIALREEALEGGAGGPMFVESVSTTLTWHLIRRYSDRAPAGPCRTRPLDGPVLTRVVDHIQENLDTELTIATLAQLAGMGDVQFGRAFKAAVGEPPYRYVTQRRMERAAKLLESSDLPISMIAYQVGLSSQSHLTTQFRKFMGTTPHAYRTARRTDR
jgi:AraC family transcriptional regulator